MLATYHRHPVAASTVHCPPIETAGRRAERNIEVRIRHLVAMALPAYGDDPARALLSLQHYHPLLEHLAQRLQDAEQRVRSEAELDDDAERLAKRYHMAVAEVRRMLPNDIHQPHPLLRPIVLRAVCGERMEVRVANRLPTPLQLALLDDDYGIQDDGAQQLKSRPLTLAPGEDGAYHWLCRQTGIFPIYNGACPQTQQHHCLLGVLMIEP